MGMKNRFDKYLKLLIYLIVIILINLVGITLFFRIDLTKNKLYTLSEVSKKVVATLSEPLTINVFFTKNLPAPHNNTERYLHDLLEEYGLHANKFFNYRFYDVNPESEVAGQKSPDNREIANNYGIYPVQIQLIEKDEVKFKKAYMGLVLIHGDIVERIPTITSTEGLEYTLTTAIQKLNHKVSALLNLSEKIEIKLFLSSALKQVAPYMGLDEIIRYPKELEHIVDKLNDKTYNKLIFSYVDPSTEKIEEGTLKKFNLMNLKWPALLKDKIEAGQGVIGLSAAYQQKTINIPLLKVFRIPIIGTQYELTDINQIEEIINDAIENLVDINEDIGYLADRGTLQISQGPAPPMGRQSQETLNSFSTLVSQNYSIKPIHIKKDAIPEALNCLIIARPVEKFSEYELYQIDQALMRGTNLMILPDAFHEVMQQNRPAFGFNPGPTFAPIDTGLEKLLTHWGIRVKKSYTLDENCFRQRLGQQMGGGETPIYFAPIIKNKNINHDVEFMRNINALVTLKISPLELDEKQIAENKIHARRLFSSSSKSWEMRDKINLNPMFIRPPSSDKMDSQALAYVLEGEFPSYFAGKPIPEKPSEDKEGKTASAEDMIKDDQIDETDPAKAPKPEIDLSKIQNQGGFLEKSKPARVFVMAASEMLKDNVIDPEGKSTNALFLMNVIDMLNHREDVAAMRTKQQRFNPLDETGATFKAFIKMFNIAGLPVMVVLFGLFMWLRRHGRKKRIQMMFS
jgi:ABC-2 type transport system permease protein